MTAFRSEVDWVFIAMSALTAALTGVAAWAVISQGHIGYALVLVPAPALIAWLLLSTSYVITDDNRLVVRSGPVRRVVDLRSIKHIKPTRSMWSAPALSLNRVEIMTDDGPLVISPADRGRFLSELVRRAPGIKLEGLSAG